MRTGLILILTEVTGFLYRNLQLFTYSISEEVGESLDIGGLI